MDEYCFQATYVGRGAYQDPATGESARPAMNYHRLVFRPRSRTAQLTIADWPTPTDPGPPEVQELACNFLEVQPYLEP